MPIPQISIFLVYLSCLYTILSDSRIYKQYNHSHMIWSYYLNVLNCFLMIYLIHSDISSQKTSCLEKRSKRENIFGKFCFDFFLIFCLCEYGQVQCLMMHLDVRLDLDSVVDVCSGRKKVKFTAPVYDCI